MKYQFDESSINPSTGHGKSLAHIRPGSLVLECGCATGYLTRYMKEKLNCRVYIVEREQEAFEIARQYAEGGACADLNGEDWTETFAGMQFDYVLFMDVLEHLYDPRQTVARAEKLLSPEGTMIVTLPNIAHNDILINLYYNRFNYSERGLLDDTHIRFFAENNLRALFAGSGLDMVSLEYTRIKTGRSEQFWENECRASEKLLEVLNQRQNGEVYQFVITLRKEAWCRENGIVLSLPAEEETAAGDTLGMGELYQKYDACRQTLDSRETELLRMGNEFQCVNKELKRVNSELKRANDELQRTKDKLARVDERCHYFERNYNLVVNTRGYRALKKYYWLREAILPNDSLRFKLVKSVLKPFVLLYRKIRNKGQTPARERLLLTREEAFDRIKNCERIDILAVNHTAYVARLLQGFLQSAGLESQVHLGEPEEYEDIPYIIICPQNYRHFPSVYIAFQMEQTINPRWLTDEYFEILQNAYAVFDYSLINIDYFGFDPVISSKMYYLPIDCTQLQPREETDAAAKEYDVLFYGAPFIERRQEYLNKIGEKYDLHIISEKFGDELYEEMRKAKIVVNIHYYENALLETTRIYETLSVCDCIVISERSGDPTEEARLEGIVDFVDVGDVQAMLDRIGYWLSHEDQREETVRKNRRTLEQRANAAKFYLYRFLLANDRITFDRFYNEAGGYIHFDTDRICLSLPESTSRRAAFDEDNQYGFDVFPGLKHYNGWVGCGMSYKFILRKAMEQQMERILVCEDDVFFPPDFKTRFQHVLDYVNSHDDWNVFSGVMADLGDISVQGYTDDCGEEFVYLNRMISMVFNLYDKSVFEAISSWDNMNRDVDRNTIDRYLENKELRILTTSPFLVGHKEDLYSTLWGAKNTIYTEGINKSDQKLKNLIDEYKKKKGGM